eukprot:CAMPEP_0196225330 /NCGR_PEP_ID=MMETSP0912-20130531/49826_1 /TAXON_ID=49265 /ORGANISM="Thalassiosira rotula, Strain GSO102" /LENGTH=58 /DNA_ID=CAMNT_0041504785 /DNA_START=528 /DNA_END=704 /DNA_ORIENTATION=+
MTCETDAANSDISGQWEANIWQQANKQGLSKVVKVLLLYWIWDTKSIFHIPVSLHPPL